MECNGGPVAKISDSPARPSAGMRTSSATSSRPSTSGGLSQARETPNKARRFTGGLFYRPRNRSGQQELHQLVGTASGG